MCKQILFVYHLYTSSNLFGFNSAHSFHQLTKSSIPLDFTGYLVDDLRASFVLLKYKLHSCRGNFGQIIIFIPYSFCLTSVFFVFLN